MTRIALIVVAAGATIACAAARLPAQIVTRPIVVEGSGGTTVIDVTSTANVVQVALPVPLVRAWGALPGVYQAMGLPVTATDPAVHLLGGEQQRVRRVAGRSMSAFFDCPGAYEDLAATGDLYLTVRTQLVPAGDSATTAYTELSAFARSKTGGQQVLCSTRAQLESLLEKKLRAAVDSTAH